MNKFKPIPLLIIFFAIVFSSCNSKDTIPLIFDTDANNEIDDQHALAYLLFNQNSFDIKGITVNSTTNGGNINKQYDEAKRVMQLCGYYKKRMNLNVMIFNENDLKNQQLQQSLNAESIEALSLAGDNLELMQSSSINKCCSRR